MGARPMGAGPGSWTRDSLASLRTLPNLTTAPRCSDVMNGRAPGITFKRVNSPERAEQLRVLRNECAFAMTRDTSQITRVQQRRFFDERVSTGEVEGFLMSANGEPV